MTLKNVEEFHSLKNVKHLRGLFFPQEVRACVQSQCESQSRVHCLLLKNLTIQGNLIVTKHRISQKV